MPDGNGKIRRGLTGPTHSCTKDRFCGEPFSQLSPPPRAVQGRELPVTIRPQSADSVEKLEFARTEDFRHISVEREKLWGVLD